jgi:hypothetical protein
MCIGLRFLWEWQAKSIRGTNRNAGKAIQIAMLSPSEERIRALCSKAVAADDHNDVEPLVAELRVALHEHIEQIRQRVKVLSRCRPFVAILKASRHPLPVLSIDRGRESA